MYDEKMKAKHEAIKKIIEEMDNLMMGKMMPKEEEEEVPMEVKVMKLEAKPEEEDDYEMESEEGESIDMTPIKELRKRLRGK
jgi:hypothetical protein